MTPKIILGIITCSGLVLYLIGAVYSSANSRFMKNSQDEYNKCMLKGIMLGIPYTFVLPHLVPGLTPDEISVYYTLNLAVLLPLILNSMTMTVLVGLFSLPKKIKPEKSKYKIEQKKIKVSKVIKESQFSGAMSFSELSELQGQLSFADEVLKRKCQ